MNIFRKIFKLKLFIGRDSLYPLGRVLTYVCLTQLFVGRKYCLMGDKMAHLLGKSICY